MEISGTTTVLPLESTVLPPNFTTGFHLYTTGNTAGIPLVISETFSIGYVIRWMLQTRSMTAFLIYTLSFSLRKIIQISACQN